MEALYDGLWRPSTAFHRLGISSAGRIPVWPAFGDSEYKIRHYTRNSFDIHIVFDEGLVYETRYWTGTADRPLGSRASFRNLEWSCPDSLRTSDNYITSKRNLLTISSSPISFSLVFRFKIFYSDLNIRKYSHIKNPLKRCNDWSSELYVI